MSFLNRIEVCQQLLIWTWVDVKCIIYVKVVIMALYSSDILKLHHSFFTRIFYIIYLNFII